MPIKKVKLRLFTRKIPPLSMNISHADSAALVKTFSSPHRAPLRRKPQVCDEKDDKQRADIIIVNKNIVLKNFTLA